MTTALAILASITAGILLYRITEAIRNPDPGICDECGGHKIWPGYHPGERPAVCPNHPK